jgi:hypothetical protein
MNNPISDFFAKKKVDQLPAEAVALLNDSKWRRRNSKWRWFVWFVGGGYGVPFFVQGLRLKINRLTILGASQCGLTIVVMSQLSDSETTTPLDDLIFGMFLAFWAAAVWFSNRFNGDVLVAKALRATEGKSANWVSENIELRGSERPAVFAAKIDASSSQVLEQSGLDAAGQKPSDDRTVSMDLNTASSSELESSGIFTAEQVQTITEKQKSGGYKSLDELRVQLNLKPHEYSRVVSHYNIRTVPAKKSGRSRRVVDL